MAKRKAYLRHSGRLSRNRSSLLYNSAVLNPNSSILDEERTFWWNDLEENTPLRYSLIHNNETTQQLSPNSESQVSHNTSQWWKYLSNDENASSSKEDRNRVTVKAHHNVIASTTSESENEVEYKLNIRKKKRINLRPAHKKSEENVFLNVLNNADTATDTETIPLKSKIREQYSDASNNELSQIKLHENTEDSLNLSSNTKRLRSHIFRKKRGNKMEDRTQRNIFQDALTKYDGSKISDSTSRAPKLSTQSANENIDVEDVDSENIEDNPNLSSNTRRLRSNIFRKKRGNKMEDSARNIFQDALSADRSKISDSTSRTTKLSTQSANENIDIEDVDSENIEDNPNLSSNTRRLRSNIFREKRGNKMEDSARNIFQDALSADRSKISDSTSRITKLSTQSANENIDIEDVDSENIKDNPNLSSNMRRLRSNIFREKRDNKMEDSARNVFQDALSADRSKISDSTSRAPRLSTQSANENIDIEDVDSETIEDNQNLRSNIFRKKRINKMEDSARNIFQDALSADRSKISDSTIRAPKLSTQSANENIDIEDVDSENIEDNPNLSTNTRRLRSNTFRKKRSNKIEDSARNVFQDALSADRSKISGSTSKAPKLSTQSANENIDIEDVDSENIEDNPNLSSNTRRLRSNIFREKRGNKMEDSARNVFQDALSADRSKISDSTSRTTKLSTQSANENIDIEDVDSENIEDNPNLSSNTRRLRSNSFKKKRDDKMDDFARARNIFQDVLSADRSKISDSTSRVPKLSTQSANENVDIENVDNVSTTSEIDIDSLPITSSTRISSTRVNEDKKAHKNATLFFNTADENVPATQTVQRNYPSPDNRTSNKTVNRQALSTDVSLNIIKEHKGISRRQKSLNRSSQNYSPPIKALSKEISIRINKLSSPKKLRTIDDFFKVKQSSTVSEPSTSNNKNLAPSQAFNEKIEKIKMELEKQRNHAVAATDKKKYELKVRNANPVNIAVKQRAKNKLPEKPTKQVDKAFLVNGRVYRVPKLPRPKYWVTDRLYKFLWKNMEEKYHEKFMRRVKSEKFVQEFAKIVSIICKCKKYDNYKMELKALMKEMARLNIVKTRDDFYNFCWDFMPYEFRVKVVPMLLPDNKRTIPYNPETLHTPLLDDDYDDYDD